MQKHQITLKNMPKGKKKKKTYSAFQNCSHLLNLFMLQLQTSMFSIGFLWDRPTQNSAGSCRKSILTKSETCGVHLYLILLCK